MDNLLNLYAHIFLRFHNIENPFEVCFEKCLTQNVDENSKLQKGFGGGIGKLADGLSALSKIKSPCRIQLGEDGIDEASFALGWCSKE